MADPEHHTLRLLREIRAAQKLSDEKLGALDTKVDKNHQEVKDRLKSVQQAITGESVLGRYAAAEVEERLTAVEKRLTALEKRR